jgi:hypothetical protein
MTSKKLWSASTEGSTGGAIVLFCKESPAPCHMGNPDKPDLAYRTNDWQFYEDGKEVAVSLASDRIRFLPDQRHRTLSDHQGLLATYRLLHPSKHRAAAR